MQLYDVEVTALTVLLLKVVTHQKVFFRKSRSKKTCKNRTCSNRESLFRKKKNCESFHDTHARFLSKATIKINLSSVSVPLGNSSTTLICDNDVIELEQIPVYIIHEDDYIVSIFYSYVAK